MFQSRFNPALKGKLFAILDETATLIGSLEVNNQLTSFATQLFINIERKGMETYTIASYLNKMLPYITVLFVRKKCDFWG